MGVLVPVVVMLRQELSLAMIKTIYGNHYNIQTLLCDTADVGHSAAPRTRMYVILSHKQRVTKTHDIEMMYMEISKRIRDLISTRPSDYLIACDSEIALEIEQLARTRKFGSHDTKASTDAFGFTLSSFCFFPCSLNLQLGQPVSWTGRYEGPQATSTTRSPE